MVVALYMELPPSKIFARRCWWYNSLIRITLPYVNIYCIKLFLLTCSALLCIHCILATRLRNNNSIYLWFADLLSLVLCMLVCRLVCWRVCECVGCWYVFMYVCVCIDVCVLVSVCGVLLCLLAGLVFYGEGSSDEKVAHWNIGLNSIPAGEYSSVPPTSIPNWVIRGVYRRFVCFSFADFDCL